MNKTFWDLLAFFVTPLGSSLLVLLVSLGFIYWWTKKQERNE